MTGTDVLESSAACEELVTMCCHCRRVRDPEGRWVERLVGVDEHVSHGICRACFICYYPDVPLPPGAR